MENTKLSNMEKEAEKFVPKCINVVSSQRLPESIMHMVSAALVAIKVEMIADKIPEPNIAVNLIVFDEDLQNAFNLGDDAIAACSKIAYCPIKNLELFGNEQDLAIAAILEELCHLIWDISDETIVKFKVLSIIRNIRKETTLEDLYGRCNPEELKESYRSISVEKRSSLPYRLPTDYD